MTLNATAFHNWYKDQQFSVLIALPFNSETVNQPGSKSYGGEIEIRHSPIDTLDLTAAIGLLHTEITDLSDEAIAFAAANPGDPGIVAAGNEFGFDPDVTYNFSANWQATEAIAIYGDVSYIGEYFTSATNVSQENGGDYIIANVGATIDIAPVNVRFFVQNVADELAFTSRFGDFSGTVLQPRTFGLSIGADF